MELQDRVLLDGVAQAISYLQPLTPFSRLLAGDEGVHLKQYMDIMHHCMTTRPVNTYYELRPACELRNGPCRCNKMQLVSRISYDTYIELRRRGKQVHAVIYCYLAVPETLSHTSEDSGSGY
jgi:hypothetical protein